MLFFESYDPTFTNSRARSSKSMLEDSTRSDELDRRRIGDALFRVIAGDNVVAVAQRLVQEDGSPRMYIYIAVNREPKEAADRAEESGRVLREDGGGAALRKAIQGNMEELREKMQRISDTSFRYISSKLPAVTSFIEQQIAKMDTPDAWAEAKASVDSFAETLQEFWNQVEKIRSIGDAAWKAMTPETKVDLLFVLCMEARGSDTSKLFRILDESGPHTSLAK
ncbi:hypothetical protein HKX48_004640, partial [Thoreauomyces humboldtii]